jgi:hypothetical protein
MPARTKHTSRQDKAGDNFISYMVALLFITWMTSMAVSRMIF